VSGIAADEERCRHFGELSLGLATALNQVIGYEAAAEVAKEAYRSGKTVAEVVLERGILSPAELAERLDPAVLTAPRSRRDEPSPR
jgi:aspartate ammonia-lyase